MLGFVSQNYSFLLHNFSKEISKFFPTRYIYFSNKDQKRIDESLEIFEIKNEIKPLKECNLLIFSDLELAEKFKDLKLEKGAFLNKFYLTSRIAFSKISFGITFFSILKNYFPIHAIKLNPFVDLEKIKEIEEKFSFFVDKERREIVLIKNDFKDDIETIRKAILLHFENPEIYVYGKNGEKVFDSEEEKIKYFVFSRFVVINSSSPFDLVTALILKKPVCVNSRTLLFEYVKDRNAVIDFSNQKEVIEKIGKIKNKTTKIKEKDFDIKKVAKNFADKIVSIVIKT